MPVRLQILTKDGRRLTTQLEDIQAERENPFYSNFYPSQAFNGLGESHQYWGRWSVSTESTDLSVHLIQNSPPRHTQNLFNQTLGPLCGNQVDVWSEPSQLEQQWWPKETLNPIAPGNNIHATRTPFLSAASMLIPGAGGSELTIESGRRNQVQDSALSGPFPWMRLNAEWAYATLSLQPGGRFWGT